MYGDNNYQLYRRDPNLELTHQRGGATPGIALKKNTKFQQKNTVLMNRLPKYS